MTIAEQQIYYWAHMLDPIDESKKCCRKEKCKDGECKGKDCTDECNENFEMPIDEIDDLDEIESTDEKKQIITDTPDSPVDTDTDECNEKKCCRKEKCKDGECIDETEEQDECDNQKDDKCLEKEELFEKMMAESLKHFKR